MARRRKHLRQAARARKRGSHKVARRHLHGAQQELAAARHARRREHQAHQPHGPSRLSADRRSHARKRAVQAAYLALRNRGTVHYTMGPARWQGINHHLESKHGEFPHYADCSSFVTWCLWNALYVTYHLPDRVNGAGWGGGFTGTLLSNGQHLTRDELQPGDVVIYGRGYPGHHTALYVGHGRVISHGSEAGPFLLPVHYRPDVMAFRRYI